MQYDWIIIDGYNLAFRGGLLPAGCDNLEVVRHKIIQKAEAMLGYVTLRASIIFDGRNLFRCENNPASPVVEVIFARGDLTADGKITRMVIGHPNPSRILVVSSDRIIRNSVEAAGASSMSAGDFWEWSDRQSQNAHLGTSGINKPTARKFGGLSLGEIFPDSAE